MSEKVTGLVVEMNRFNCILMTPDGDFVEAAKPRGRKLSHGEEATLYRHQPFLQRRRLALVACLMIAIMGWTAYSSYIPVAVAYVSLDINPSLELAVDNKGQVIKATSFNPEAETLLGQVQVKGRPVTEVIGNLIDSAVTLNYIDPDKTNEILVTVELESPTTSNAVSQKIVEDTITQSIAKNNVAAELSVTPVEPSLRKQASQEKVSTGRYLLYQELQRQGKMIEVKEVKDLQQKHLDELGYHNWSPEQIHHLSKNQNITIHKNESQIHPDSTGSWPNPTDIDTSKNSSVTGQDKNTNNDNQQQNASDDKHNIGRQKNTRIRSHQQSGDDQNGGNSQSSETDTNNHNSWYQNHLQSGWNQKLEDLKKNQSEKGKTWDKNRNN